ncbi:MAG: tRNA (adenosine(37)-N6)-threonylcarbamoyltransferase complex ATPase subunit type 1 TsaE [Candidatus Omnitrophota bacterium]|nr:tRNA (adenosine(37)-N6)-threonylcarbamoyltransferase complex ATPase subunit type 1 TsaE [Candidatus Omnitrophota bacterium]
MQILSRSPQQTINLGKKLSPFFKKGDIICLFGGLGTGKTTFVKGLAHGLGIKSNVVNSPSFVLIKEFKGRLPFFHFDLYRIKNLKEILSLGLEEYLFDDAVCVIEWAKHLGKEFLDSYLKIGFNFKSPEVRLIKFSYKGVRYKNLIKLYENIIH